MLAASGRMRGRPVLRRAQDRAEAIRLLASVDESADERDCTDRRRDHGGLIALQEGGIAIEPARHFRQALRHRVDDTTGARHCGIGHVVEQPANICSQSFDVRAEPFDISANSGKPATDFVVSFWPDFHTPTLYASPSRNAPARLRFLLAVQFGFPGVPSL